MATAQQMKDVGEKIKRRVEHSADMLAAMGIPREVYERTVLNALVLAPTLAECQGDSLEAAMIRSINARLLPDGKEAVIVPFKGVATFIPMIDGQVKLAHSATPGLTLRVRLVYKDDDWEYEEGLAPVLKHKPNSLGDRTDDSIVAAYAVAQLPQALQPIYEVMWRSDILRIMAFSPSVNSAQSPWRRFFPEMCQKTVLRRLLRRLPQPIGFVHEVETPPELTGVEYSGYQAVDTATGEIYDPSAPRMSAPAEAHAAPTDPPGSEEPHPAVAEGQGGPVEAPF